MNEDIEFTANTLFPMFIGRLAEIGQDELGWTDGCMYDNPQDSSEYLYLSIATYGSNDAAERLMERSLPDVGDHKVLINNEASSEKAIYSSGVLYFRRENRFIIVAGGDTSSAASEPLVKRVFSDIRPSL